MKPHIHKEPEKLQSECTLEEKEKKFFSKHRHSKTFLWKIDFLEPTLMQVRLFGVGEKVSFTLSMVTGTLTGHLVSERLTCAKPYVVPHELCCSQTHNQDPWWTTESLWFTSAIRSCSHHVLLLLPWNTILRCVTLVYVKEHVF